MAGGRSGCAGRVEQQFPINAPLGFPDHESGCPGIPEQDPSSLPVCVVVIPSAHSKSWTKSSQGAVPRAMRSRKPLTSSTGAVRPKRLRRRPHLSGWLPVLIAAGAGAMLLGVSADGGRQTREAQPLVVTIDRMAAAVGLGLTEIRVTGHRQTDDRDVFEALKLANVHSLFGFDAAAARERIEQLPWVRSATIQRSFPDAVNVTVAERLPFAIWDNAGRRLLIDDTGRVLGPAPVHAADLPVVAGEGAAQEAGLLMATMGDYQKVLRRLLVAQRVENRRWSLVLDGGMTVHLPAEGEAEAMWRLTMPRAGGALIDRAATLIDLRSTTQVVIAPVTTPPVVGFAPLGRGVATGGARSGGPEIRSE